jgi:hypothetical protein
MTQAFNFKNLIQDIPYGTSNIFLYGLPGVGKTETALKMAFNFIKSEKYNALCKDGEYAKSILCFDYDNRVEGNEYYRGLNDDDKNKIKFINASIACRKPNDFLNLILNMSKDGIKFGVVVIDALNIMSSIFYNDLEVKQQQNPEKKLPIQAEWGKFYKTFEQVILSLNNIGSLVLYTSTASNLYDRSSGGSFTIKDNHFKSAFKVSKVKHLMDVIVQLVADKETTDKNVYIHKVPNVNMVSHDYKNAIAHYKEEFSAETNVNKAIDKIFLDPFVPNKPTIDSSKILQQQNNLNIAISFEEIRDKVLSYYTDCIKENEDKIFNLLTYQSLVQEYSKSNPKEAAMLRTHYDSVIKPILLGDGMDNEGLINENLQPVYRDIALSLKEVVVTDKKSLTKLTDALKVSPLIQDWKVNNHSLYAVVTQLYTQEWSKDFNSFNEFVRKYNPNVEIEQNVLNSDIDVI